MQQTQKVKPTLTIQHFRNGEFMIEMNNENLSKKELIYLNCVLGNTYDLIMRDYLINLIRCTKVTERSYDSYGLHVFFDTNKEYNCYQNIQKEDIPILFDAYVNLPELDYGVWILLYLSENRKSLDLIEVSIEGEDFNEELLIDKIIKDMQLTKNVYFPKLMNPLY